MSKKWIYEGECRNPKSGEFFVDICQHPRAASWPQGVVRQVPEESVQHGAPYPIVHPIPDDVVMVPRERIEALRESMKVDADGLWLPARFEAASSAILSCAEPEKPKDEILETMRSLLNLFLTDVPERRSLENAIALRKKELKERDG